MTKQYLLIIFCALFYLPISSQEKVSEEEQAQMVTIIEQRARSIKSLRCEFRQEKTLKLMNHSIMSYGKLNYCQPGKLKWEYNKPYMYSFIINNSKVVIKNDEHTNVIDATQSKIFKEVTQIMINSVTGKCLSNKKDFSVEMYKTSDCWIAYMEPRNKELQAMFKQIKLYVDVADNIVNKVELIENNNDVTRIQLQNIQINIHIDETVFCDN